MTNAYRSEVVALDLIGDSTIDRYILLFGNSTPEL